MKRPHTGHDCGLCVVALGDSLVLRLVVLRCGCIHWLALVEARVEARWLWVWSVACGLWPVVCGLWSVVCGLWSVVCGLWSVVCGLWSVVCGLWSVACGLWSVVCDLNFVEARVEACRAVWV